MSDDNIIPFQLPPKPSTPKPPPMLNIPPVTQALAAILIVIHLVITVGDHLFSAIDFKTIAIAYGGFLPASWSGSAPFEWWTPGTLLTFSLLHAGLIHLGVNVLMLVAMGSGLEKSIGVRDYALVYVGSTLCAALTHFAIYPDSMTMIIGASGGVNGILGAMIYLMKPQQSNGKILPVILIYIGISVAVGYMGTPDGSDVAWVAHIGGFLSGIGIMMALIKHRK